MTFDILSDSWCRCLSKYMRDMDMRVSRDCLDLAINTRSSAKRRAEMLMEPRFIPKSDALSSGPSELMKRLNRRGHKLQPIFWDTYDFITF